MIATASAVGTLPGTEIDAAALAEVERLFRQQLSPLRLFPGGAVAVYYRGQLVLDLVGGYADTQCGEPVRPETLFPLFSGTKPFAAVALWQQIERGRVGLEESVAAYWPAFGRNGKERVLVRHILSHRGGFPATPPELTPDLWGEWETAMRAVEGMPLDYSPGTVSAYHHLTQQWVCAELVRRLDGRAYQDYLYEEIIVPLGLDDTYLGLPVEFEDRLSKLHATDGTDEWGLGVLKALSGLRLHRMVVPGASGVSTAGDMARFYATIAAGGALDDTRILGPETVERMLTVEVDNQMDATFDVPVRRGLGFELGGLTDPRRHWPGTTSTVRTFWHGGFGSSICWGDRDLNLTMAFMSNGVRRDEAGAIARRDLSDAVRAIGR